MQNLKKSTSRVRCTAFIDFKPAELRLNKDWIIVYYIKHPISNEMERQRLRVPVIKNPTERLRHAKRIVIEINQKLVNGWNPYFEEKNKSYKSLESALTDFMTDIDKQVADKVKRNDTRRSYNTACNTIRYFAKKIQKTLFAFEINRQFCIAYLDYVYLTKRNSPRTRNNNLALIKIFCNYLLQHGIIVDNPAIGIVPLKIQTKKRVSFDTNTKKRIATYFETLSNGFPTMSYMLYYCFLRNLELSKLKVENIDLETNTITIPSEISKNKKTETITIPSAYKPILIAHLRNAKNKDYVFSDNNFCCGTKMLKMRQIQSVWDKLRKELKLSPAHQFYGFKDTGITDLLNAGVPAIKVRDQARHSDIKITEIYAQRKNTADETIEKLNMFF